MEFRDALKAFRSEVGLFQADIANALHVNAVTVGRWERGGNTPNRSTAIALLAYAKKQSATNTCVENLEKSLNNAARQKLSKKKNVLFTVEHDTISQLIEDASFPVYVCDLATDEILYANRATEQQQGKSLEELAGKKCYECIMRRDKPCDFCHKEQLVEDSFSIFEAFRHFDGNYCRIPGKLVKWNGHAAQVRYIYELGGSVQISSSNELRFKYEEQLAMRRKFAGDALAIAHYNLTLGKVSQVECQDERIAERLVTGRYEDVIRALSENIFAPEEQIKFDSIHDRKSLIQMFFQGKTHISIKHRIKNRPGYYEGTFDLFQNPITYDVEAFAVLRDITEATVSEQIMTTLLNSNFETITTIDALTGEAHPYRGKHFNEVIKEQEKQGDNAAGVEAYLRLHCADEDVERVIQQTRLPYVKEQLKTKSALTVAYSLRENDHVIYKQAHYSYLDKEQTSILCATEDISEAYKQFESKDTAE